MAACGTGSSPSQERTRTGLENRLSMLPARSRPADAPVKAKALYRARVGSVGVATPCAGALDRPANGGPPASVRDFLSGAFTNGLPLTKIHHAAFDANLIGIDPDYRIHVSDRLLEIHDGPFLELGLKQITGTLIQLPRRIEDHPDRDRLAFRFEEFRRLR